MSDEKIVTLFPSKEGSESKEPTTVEEVKERHRNIRKFQADETADLCLAILLENVYMSGFFLNFKDSDNFTKDLALTVESIRSLLYKYHSIPHRLQAIADDTFVLADHNVVKYKDSEATVNINQPEEEEILE